MKLASLRTATFTLAALTLLACTGKAQEALPQEDLDKIVPRLLKQVADLDNLPIKTNAVLNLASGMKVKSYAAVVIPDQALTKEALEKVGKEVLPLGQLWLNKLSPADGSTITPTDKLRMVTVTAKEEDHRVALLLLGARKTADGSLELVIYAKQQEPLQTLPLRAFKEEHDLPLTIEMRQGTVTMGELDIDVLSQYRATLRVGERE